MILGSILASIWGLDGMDLGIKNEVEISIKSNPEVKKALMVYLQKILSYDVPQIIYKKFNSEKKYINWLKKSISS